VTLPRGFKTLAERTALEFRSKLGLRNSDPINLTKLAGLLDARVISAEALVPIERLHEIERLQAFAFSGCTFEVRGKSVVVFNPIRAVGRQSSDIAHELAHIVLKHDLSEIEYLGDTAFRTCRSDQEEQATVLGGTLLLPRPLLLGAARRGLTLEQVAAEYDVTIEMARFRWNTTGVGRQASSRATVKTR
jgi:Zn-dependent peptidase ImmA (M78 family)